MRAKELDTTAWELPGAAIVSHDVAADGYVFLLTAGYTEDEEGIKHPGSFRLVYTDPQGMMVSQMDLSSVMHKLKEQGLFQLAGISNNQLYRDREGYLYFLTVQSTVLFVLDAQAYQSGGKDALIVTRDIDNRVQLYLDEGN